MNDFINLPLDDFLIFEYFRIFLGDYYYYYYYYYFFFFKFQDLIHIVDLFACKIMMKCQFNRHPSGGDDHEILHWHGYFDAASVVKFLYG